MRESRTGQGARYRPGNRIQGIEARYRTVSRV
jgi:hypothetical protein